MGDDDMADVLIWLNSRKYCLQMGSAFGAGVNHRQPVRPQQVCVGPAVRHGGGVGGDDPAQPGFEGFGHADGGIESIRGLHGFGLSLGMGLAYV